MELVEGHTLRALMRDPPSVERSVSIGSQVADALAAAHESGVVHRDIKPENIMIRADGYVKVLDFGLARTVGDVSSASHALTLANVTLEGFVLGTIPYMSPEQTRDDPLSPATDVFSLGVVLYELVTGVHPFASASSLSVAVSIVSHNPVPPARLNPELSATLDALVMEMLEKDPLRRPTSTAVSTTLGTFGRARGQAALPVGTQSSTFVGREAQLRNLESSLQEVLGGAGRVHAIAAEGGFGKTTLVNYFLAKVSQTDHSIIGRGRCSERLAGTEAFLPLLEALEGMLRDSNADVVARAMRVLAPDWYAQLRSTSAFSNQLPTTHVGSWEQMKRQLNALVQELTRARPLVLFLDDVQWAAPSTLDLISYLCDRYDSLRLLVLMAFRPSEVQTGRSPFLELRSHLQIRGTYRETVMQSFSLADVEQYVDLAFPGHDFTKQFLSVLYQRTEGVPLFVVDLLRQFVEQEIIIPTAAGWALAPAVHDLETGVPDSVRALIQRSVERLDEQDRRVMVAASVQGFTFDSAVVAKALQFDPEETEERIDRVERAHGIIRLVDQCELSGHTPSLRYAFTHHYYHNAFQDSIRGLRRRKLSASVASAVLQYHGSDGAIASELALLYQAANEFGQSAVHYLAAVQHAASVFAHKETVLLARRGLDMLVRVPESRERDRLEFRLLAALGLAMTALSGFAAPDVETVYSRARELCDRLGDTAGRFAALFGISRYYFIRGRLETLREVAEQLLVVASEGNDPLQVVVAHNTMGLHLIHVGAYEHALEHFFAVSAAYKPEHRAALRAMYNTDVGMTCLLWRALALWLLGYADESAETQRTALALASEHPAPFELGYAHCISAWLQQCRGDVASVREHADFAIQIAQEHDFAMFLAIGTIFRSWVLAVSNHPAEGIGGLQRALDGFKRTGAQLYLPYFNALLADAYRIGGDVESGLSAIEDGLRYAQTNGDRLWEPELRRLRGELLLARPGVTGSAPAEETFRAALGLANSQGSVALGARAAVSLAGLLSRQQRHEEARLLSAQIDASPRHRTVGVSLPAFHSTSEIPEHS
jgi:tetratricopeptide (TPR) repeat protein